MATDQEIRDAGLLYIPKQKYLQDPYNLSTPPPPPPPDGGITNTNAFANSGNDFSVYNPDPNSIVNRNADSTRYNNLMENSFLKGGSNSTNQIFNPKRLDGAQMPDELGVSTNTVPLGNNRISSSQLGINLPGGQVQNAYTRARNAMNIRGDDTMSRDYPEFTAKEIARLTNNSIQDYRQNYGAQGQYESDNYYDTVPSEVVYNSQTELDKFKDNYPEYFGLNQSGPKEGIAGIMEKYMTNSFLGKGINAAGNFVNDLLPTNRRAMLENQLGVRGVMVNDIGQIVQGDGSYDDASGRNVMAGYNANKLTAESFDKRIAMAKDKMSDKNKGKRIAALEAAKADFLRSQKESDFMYDEEEENKKKKDTIISRLFKKKKEAETADTTTDGGDIINPTGPSNAPGGTPGGSPDNFTLDGGMTYDNSRGDFRNADGSNVNQDFSTPASLSNYDASVLYADGGRVYFFDGGRVGVMNGGLASIL